MDKSGNDYVYTPPRVVPRAYVQRETASEQARVVDSSQAQSFDNALDRIRDRLAAREQGVEKQQSMDLASDTSRVGVEEADLEGVSDASSDVEISDPEGLGLQQQALESVGTENAGVQSTTADSIQNGESTDASPLHLSDTAIMSFDMAQSFASGSAHGETQAGLSFSGGESGFQGAAIAENIIAMMLRMERAAGVYEGQWRFAVLDNPMGVSALQMQRSAQGSWRVGLTLDQTNAIDEVAHAETLKEALLSRGHNVDAVTVTRLDSSQISDS